MGNIVGIGAESKLTAGVPAGFDVLPGRSILFGELLISKKHFLLLPPQRSFPGLMLTAPARPIICPEDALIYLPDNHLTPCTPA